MSTDDHYYATGYDVSDDPYVYNNGVLINHFSIQDTASLNEIEALFAAEAISELLQQPLPDQFNLIHLCYLHQQIFMEVYPWAGSLRQVDICKGDTYFAKHADIESKCAALFDQLALEYNFKGLPIAEFCNKAGIFLSQLNFIHPFREGNGRTQRLLISQLALNNDIEINWLTVSNDAMRAASIAGEQGQYRPMQRLLLLNSDSIY